MATNRPPVPQEGFAKVKAAQAQIKAKKLQTLANKPKPSVKH